MPPDNVPSVRIDREFLNSVELALTEQMLYRIWDVMDALTVTGAVYGRVILPPDMAEAKRRASMIGNQS